MSVPVIPQPACNMLPSAPGLQNNGKKRRRAGSSPDPTLRQRTPWERSSGVDITSLSDDQVATLTKAASILQLPTSALLDLAAKPQRKAKRQAKRLRRLSPEVTEIRSRTMENDITINSQSRQFLSRTDNEDTSTFSNSISDMCNVPSFTLGLLPKQIADCFATFSQCGEEPSSNIGYIDGGVPYTRLPYSDFGPLDMSMNSSSSITLPSTRIQSNTSSRFSDYLDLSLQTNDRFACDEFAPPMNQSQLQAQTPMRKTWPLQHNQPVVGIETMTYSTEPHMSNAYIEPVYNEPDHYLYSNHPNSFDREDSSDLVDLSTDTTDTSLECHDSESEDQVCAERPGPTPRRPFQTPQDRLQTAQTRKHTACIRCRMQRIRCHPDPDDPSGICLTCKRVVKPKMSKLPCLRYKLADVRLFREGSFAPGHEWTHRFLGKKMPDITNWASSTVRTIYITQDYGDSAITLKVREFVPMKGDMLHRQWADGDIIKMVPIANYAVVDMAAALQAHKDHIVNDGPKYFKSALKYNDRLLWDTYTIAIKFSNHAKTEEEKELLRMVLQLWVTVRMCVKSQRISGPETLGMSSDIMDRSSPMHGKIPVPPVLSAQAQFIVTQKLQAPLRTKILELLQKLTLAQRPSNWFCIYLSTFILLHNCSLLTEHDVGYARKHGLKTRHARLDMVRELHSGANVLLAHFHYCCKGFRPFSLDWNPAESSSMAELDTEQVRFIRQTAVYVNFNEIRFKKLLDDCSYDTEHYFLAQLYEENWQPRSNV